MNYTIDEINKFEEENKMLLGRKFKRILELHSEGYYGDCRLTKSIDYIVDELVKIAIWI